MNHLNARNQLIQILREPRDDGVLILSKSHVQQLECLHTEYQKYPQLIEEYYQLVRDFADTKSMELVMDHSWTLEETRLVKV